MLDTVREVTQTRRSTAGLTERLPEAEACLDRIRAWRENGGKVACLFGKVVCDSQVPFDGGPAHSSMKDWLNHAIESVRGSRTLLLIKPHPHELRHDIGVFLTETFADLIEVDPPENIILLGHRWFDLQDLDGLIDLGVIYNGTSAAELGVLGIPCVLCGHFGPIDYPIGHAVPENRQHFRHMLRFSRKIPVAKDLKERAAAWIYFMSGDNMARDYRYHARQITNRVVYPPWWFRDDIERYLAEGDPNVGILMHRALETRSTKDDPARISLTAVSQAEEFSVSR
jgi:capsular polysaccharide export protein